MRKQIFKYAFLFWFGGSFYVTLEVLFRERSHWSMFILAGLIFITVGGLNRIWGWKFPLFYQVLTGVVIATVGEFVCGCIVNLWLRWNIWSYEGMWGNVLGQICPQFTLLWAPLMLVAIVLDDVISWKFFNEENPRYYIGNKCFEIK